MPLPFVNFEKCNLPFTVGKGIISPTSIIETLGNENVLAQNTFVNCASILVHRSLDITEISSIIMSLNSNNIFRNDNFALLLKPSSFCFWFDSQTRMNGGLTNVHC